MLLVPACVAVQIIGASPAPGAIGALENRCGGILGGDRCRVVGETPAAAPQPAPACWQATVTVSARGAAAQVVLRAARGAEVREARRDIAFQERDAIDERWATLGLVIAALVTIEERAPAPAEQPALPPAPEPARAPPAPPPIPPISPILATTAAVPAREIPVRARGGPGIHAALAGIAATGPLPGTALGARVEMGLDWTRAGILLRAAYFPDGNRATVPVTTGMGGGDFRMWSLGLGGCTRTRATRALAMRACAGGARASTAAAGFGVADSGGADAQTTMLWAGLGMQAHLTRRLALVAEPELTLAVQRPAFAIRGAGTVFTPARIGGGLALGLLVEL